jgi:hypothetical protein
MKFMLASLKKHLLILKVVPKAAYNFRSGFPLLSLVNFFLCTFIAGFRNNFQNDRRVSEHLLKAQAAYPKAGTSSLQRVTGRNISQLVRDFIEANINLILDFLHKKTTEIVKTVSAHAKSRFCFEF